MLTATETNMKQLIIRFVLTHSLMIKVNFLLLMMLIYAKPGKSQDYQVKFFAYPKQSEICTLKGGKWFFYLSPNEHFYILFEKRQQYEASYGYSPDKFFAKSPFSFNTKHGDAISSDPLHAYAFSMREETYQLLKPDSMVYFFSSFNESVAYANKILRALGKKTPDITDSTMCATKYVLELIRLNTLYYNPITDERDGQIYNTIKIANQIWMAENLRYKPDSINVWHPKNETYGRLYGYKTALSACPSGWHLSTKEEWDTLIAYAGGANRAGITLKSTDFWLYPETFPEYIGTDSLGFRVLPAGYPTVFENGLTWFWTASQLYPGYIWMVTFTYYNKGVGLGTTINGEHLDRGHSVRCVKDF